MLDFFPKGSLPGEDPSSETERYDTDVTSFQDLWLTADLIETCCLVGEHIPGWASDGMSSLFNIAGSSHSLTAILR